jgi:hypothetical protein
VLVGGGGLYSAILIGVASGSGVQKFGGWRGDGISIVD